MAARRSPRISARIFTPAACAVLLAAGLTACSTLSYPDDAVTISIAEPSASLIPGNANASGNKEVAEAIWTMLVEYEPKTAQIQMAAAQSITTKDQKDWLIKIRPGWTFHDGSPMTAESFVKAWNWSAYGPNGAANRSWFEPIQGYDDLSVPKNPDGTKGTPKAQTMSGLKVIDPLTFSVTLKNRVSSFEYQLGYQAFAPLPESFFADPVAFAKNPIGNGPFTFFRWDRRRDLIVNKYQDFKGEQAAANSIMFKFYQSQDAAYADLLAGNLDILPKMPTSVLLTNQAKTDLNGRVIEQPYGAIRAMGFPLYDDKFKDPLLRRAISMAIDREQVVKQVLAGTAIPADGYVPPVVFGYKPANCGPNCTFNPDEAKKLFKQSKGFDGTLTFAYNADGGHKPSVDAICQSINRVLGINCVGKPFVDFSTYVTAYTGHEMTGAFTSGWAMDYPLNENFILPLYTSDGSSNSSGYSNPKVDQLMHLGETQPLDQSVKTYAQAEQLVGQDVPQAPLWYSEVTAGYSDKVTDVVFTPFGDVDIVAVKRVS